MNFENYPNSSSLDVLGPRPIRVLVRYVLVIGRPLERGCGTFVSVDPWQNPSNWFLWNQRDEGQDFLDRVQIRNKVHIFGTDINIQRKQIDLGVWSGSERRSQFVLFLFDPVQIPEPDPSLYIYVRSKITRRIKMTIKGPYLILTNPDTLINTTANRLTRSHIRTEVSLGDLSGYNVNTGIINDPSLCHKIKNHKIFCNLVSLLYQLSYADFELGNIWSNI